MTVEPNPFAHVRFKVTDLGRSRAFYDAVFGPPVDVELPPDADDETREELRFLFGDVTYQIGDTLLGLHKVSQDEFREHRTGLDHVSFAVADREALMNAVKALDGFDVAHEGIKDVGAGRTLEFRDPDGVVLETLAARPV